MINHVGTRRLPKHLQAHVERRSRLTAQIRSSHPAFTEDEIAARLEIFGA